MLATSLKAGLVTPSIEIDPSLCQNATTGPRFSGYSWIKRVCLLAAAVAAHRDCLIGVTAIPCQYSCCIISLHRCDKTWGGATWGVVTHSLPLRKKRWEARLLRRGSERTGHSRASCIAWQAPSGAEGHRCCLCPRSGSRASSISTLPARR